MRVALSFILLFSATNVLACTCISENEQSEKESILRQYNEVELVFIGEVIEVEILHFSDTLGFDENGQPSIFKSQRLEYTFSISNLLKGDNNSAAIITTSGDNTSCRFVFKKDVQYLVYSYKSKYEDQSSVIDKVDLTYFWTDICTRTSRIDHVTDFELSRLKRHSKRHKKAVNRVDGPD